VTRGRKVLIAILATVVVLGAAGTTVAIRYFNSRTRTTSAELRSQVAALEKERDALRTKLEALDIRDHRLEGMPQTRIRVMVPTTLAGRLVEKFISGFADQITLQLRNIKVHKAGTVKKVVTLGAYDLNVLINQVTGRIKTGQPTVTFGDNRIGLALPATVASGSGRATINFTWDGKNVSGAVCGDMNIGQVVTGNVVPDTYAIKGSFSITSKGATVFMTPSIPPVVVNLRIKPSDESWAAVKKILDDKQGVCGFVLDRVDIMGVVKSLIDKGFNVKLPTERLRPVAMPVTVDPEFTVKGRQVGMNLSLSGLAITEHAIWVGADVSIAPWLDKAKGAHK
jgi:hypothetical protein